MQVRSNTVEEEMKELERLASQARAKKGRMDAEGRAKAASLMALVWSNPAVDPRPTLEFLEDFQSEAIADGIGSIWAKISSDRRALFQRWVPSPETDRAYRRLALLASNVLSTDGATALQWLGLLIPRDKRSVNKESRELLAPIFFGDKQLRFEEIAHDGAPPSEVLRIYSALFDIATDHSLSVGAIARSRLASAILTYISATGNSSDGSAAELESKVFIDMKKWPAALREQFQRQVKVFHQATSEPQRPIPGAVLIIDEPKARLSNSLPGSFDVSEGLNRIQTEMSDHVTAIGRELDLLRSLHAALKSAGDGINHLQQELGETKQQLSSVEIQLRGTVSDRDAARRDLKGYTERVLELTASLEALRVDTDAERKRLGQQIAANATGRIEEFKKRLGLSLSRLVVDLPDAGMPVSSELGKILLLQFHQFLEALGQEGIETRPGVRSK
jgi:hypothetical protein